MTRTLHLDGFDPNDLRRAAKLLQEGGLVAFATETVYGLGANALSNLAVAKIFEAKQRPGWDPLIVHLASDLEVSRVAKIPSDLTERVGALARAFWPGPLTLLLPRTGVVPDLVTAGRPLVGVRVPAHPAARALLEAAGLPIAAPSANRFGHISPTTAAHVLADLDGRIDAVLDAGPTSVGVESTVLDPTQTPMLLYRPGAVTPEQLAAATGVAVEVFVVKGDERPAALPSPGVGIRHYAPRARLMLVKGTAKAVAEGLEEATAEGQRVGVLLPEGWDPPAAAVVRRWGQWGDAASLAASLFAGLRSLDERGVGVIVCPLPEQGGLADAIRDRLSKAARPR